MADPSQELVAAILDGLVVEASAEDAGVLLAALVDRLAREAHAPPIIGWPGASCGAATARQSLIVTVTDEGLVEIWAVDTSPVRARGFGSPDDLEGGFGARVAIVREDVRRLPDQQKSDPDRPDFLEPPALKAGDDEPF